MNDLLNEIEDTLKDPFNFTHEAIEFLKNVVQLKGEEMKAEIKKKMDHCLKKLETYKGECKSGFKTNEYLKESNRFFHEKESTRKQLDEWLNTLNEIKFNESEWKRIKSESATKIDIIRNELDRFKAEVLLQRRYGEFRAEIEHNFDKFEIDDLAFKNLE